MTRLALALLLHALVLSACSSPPAPYASGGQLICAPASRYDTSGVVVCR